MHVRFHTGSSHIPFTRINLVDIPLTTVSLSVRVFQVILGRPGPRFPSICMSQTVLIAPLDHSKCQNQRSLFSLRIMSRSLISSRANSSFILTVATYSGFTIQICLIMAQSLRRKRWRSGLVKGQVSLA